MPKASVAVMNERTGAQRRVVTDDAGIYSVAELPVGYYTIRVSALNMSGVERARVKVDVGGETRVDLQLSVESVAQSLDVRAGAPDLQQDSSGLAEVVGTRQVQELPMNGRDFRRIALLVPGASTRSARGSLGSFTSDGQREKSNIFLIDGIDNNDSFRNQPSFNQGGVNSAMATRFRISFRIADSCRSATGSIRSTIAIATTSLRAPGSLSIRLDAARR